MACLNYRDDYIFFLSSNLTYTVSLLEAENLWEMWLLQAELIIPLSCI